MRFRHVSAVAVALAALLVATCTSPPRPWAAEAERWIDTWFTARSEGIANELSFYDPNVVWEDRTGGHLFSDRDSFVAYAAALLGERDPAEQVDLFVSAGEAVVQYRWPTWHPPVDYVARLRVGSTGIDHVVNTASTRAGRAYVPDAVDFDAVDELAHRWVAYWNGDGNRASQLYAPGAVIDDTLAGLSATGPAIMDDARRIGAWPDLPPMAVESLPDGMGAAVMSGPAIRSYDIDEIAIIVRLDDPACPRRLAVFLGWNGERILWERRSHELRTARACEPVSTFVTGWWVGLAPPEPIARVFTGVVTEPSTGAEVDVYNGDEHLHRVVAHLLGHFAAAGIGVPEVGEFAFVEYRSRCTAWDGFSTTGEFGATVNICLDEEQICDDDACTTIDHHAELMMLHELAHAWLFDHTDDDLRRAFTAYVGLEHWNDLDDDWSDRAMERAASAIAVGVAGDLGPQGCDDGRYCDVLPGSYELLTGRAPTLGP